MSSETRDSDRDRFFGECSKDYADAMTALATFQSWAAERCEAALKKRASELIPFNGKRPVAFEAFHRPEKPSAELQFRCGAQASYKGNDGPNVVCWLLWSHQPNKEGFQHGFEVCIWLRNSERKRRLYDVIRRANPSSALEIDSDPRGGPTFRRYPGPFTAASVDGHLSQLLLDMYTMLEGIPGIKEALEPGEVVLGPRLKAIYKVLKDGNPHEFTDMLDELPQYLPENQSIDNTPLKKLLKTFAARGKKYGRWKCTLRDGVAQMETLPAEA
jgi:hypothetical protein